MEPCPGTPPGTSGWYKHPKTKKKVYCSLQRDGSWKRLKKKEKKAKLRSKLKRAASVGGVARAMFNTIQGQSGYYQDLTGRPALWSVVDGKWELVAKPSTLSNAATLVQKIMKGFLARKRVEQLRKERMTRKPKRAPQKRGKARGSKQSKEAKKKKREEDEKQVSVREARQKMEEKHKGEKQFSIGDERELMMETPPGYRPLGVDSSRPSTSPSCGHSSKEGTQHAVKRSSPELTRKRPRPDPEPTQASLERKKRHQEWLEERKKLIEELQGAERARQRVLLKLAEQEERFMTLQDRKDEAKRVSDERAKEARRVAVKRLVSHRNLNPVVVPVPTKVQWKRRGSALSRLKSVAKTAVKKAQPKNPAMRLEEMKRIAMIEAKKKADAFFAKQEEQRLRELEDRKRKAAIGLAEVRYRRKKLRSIVDRKPRAPQHDVLGKSEVAAAILTRASDLMSPEGMLDPRQVFAAPFLGHHPHIVGRTPLKTAQSSHSLMSSSSPYSISRTPSLPAMTRTPGTLQPWQWPAGISPGNSHDQALYNHESLPDLVQETLGSEDSAQYLAWRMQLMDASNRDALVQMQNMGSQIPMSPLVPTQTSAGYGGR